MGQHVVPISDIMKGNIDTILNSDYELESNNNNAGINITERPTTCILDIECKFHGRTKETNEDFSFEPYNINKLTMTQQFNANYSDDISLVITVTPMQLISLLDNYRDLKCTLLMKPRDVENEYVYDEDLILDKTYIVLLKDKDLRRRLPKKAIIPDSMLDKNNEHSGQLFDNIEIQLITEAEYTLRKKQFNFIARESTVKDVILFLAQSCDVTTVCMTEPDNTTTYTNMIIPPRQTFATCMEFLQDYYGIYNKGLSYYFTDDILYVYPAYDTNPTTPESAHLYYAGQGAYSGAKIYHAMSDDIAHIVINETPVINELVDKGIENFGNVLTFQHAGRIIDLGSTMGEGASNTLARMGMGVLDLKEPNTSIFAFEKEDIGISAEVYTDKFQFDNSNQYKYKSEVYGFRRELLGTKWQNASPRMFKPGYLVHWHYDGEDTSRQNTSDEYNASTESGELQVDAVEPLYSDSAEYMTRSGICEAVTWVFQPAGAKTAKGMYYSCVAEMVFSLEYEPAKEEETSVMNTSAVASGANGGTTVVDSIVSSVTNLGLVRAATSFWNL